MSRAPFNTVAHFFNGPGQPSPGVVRFGGPARFVRADGIHQVGLGAPTVVGWVTTESGVPVGAWVSPKLGLDPALSDQVSIDGDPNDYYVLWAERVQWHGADYYRATLAYLPLPDACDCSSPPPPVCPHYDLTGAPPPPLTLPVGQYVLDVDFPNTGTGYLNADSGSTEVWTGDCDTLDTLLATGIFISWPMSSQSKFVLNVTVPIVNAYWYYF